MQNIFSATRWHSLNIFESHNIHIVITEILVLKRMCDRVRANQLTIKTH